MDIILEFTWNLGFWLTIYYFSPNHTFISEFISHFANYLLTAFEGTNNKFFSTDNIIIFTICYFINFCCILIFNEIVILNFFGLDHNTIKRIQQRERTESNIENFINLDSLSQNEDENSQEN